jgi:dTDP-4-amino-4,6-dideoxygalactose transaminase/CelD/BcsL family acetyltransferase involved in cellulose biosynthesis
LAATWIDVWPSLPPTAYLRPRLPALPFPLGERGCILFARGRHGLWHAACALGLDGAEVLVPAYHHGSEIEALGRAGAVCRFYDGDERLAPAEDELEALLTPETRALHLTHYLGFPQDSERWRRWCDERRLLLLEDAAQAWLAEADGVPVGSHGDASVFCLYKSIPVPDGGALLLRARSVARAEGERPGGLAQLARAHARWAVQRWPLPLPERRREGSYDPARDFELGDPDTPAASATEFLLPRLADSGVAPARRRNYAFLLEALGDLTRPPFDRLPDGSAPFAFPLDVADKRSALRKLRSHGVRALDLWSVAHPLLSGKGFPRAAERRGRTVGLPVHQGLGPGDLERVVRALRGRRVERPALRLDPEAPEAMREEWDELAVASRNVFSTWEWFDAWRRHKGERAGRVLVLACRGSSGRVVGIVPLHLSRRAGLRLLRFAGHGPGDELGPICAPSDRATVAAALRRFLSERDDWDVFLGERLAGEDSWSRLLNAQDLRREASPVLRSRSGWEDYLASRSAGLRKQLRRYERLLGSERELRHRLTAGPDRLADDLNTLFALHRRVQHDDESPFAGDDEAFHREFAARALERGWLRLWFLELDGESRAAWYGFRFAGVESFYQSGRVPWPGEISLGLVLLAHTIREALDDGVAEYRFLRGGEPYKYRFATGDPGLETVALASRVAGRAALAALRARLAISSRAS